MPAPMSHGYQPPKVPLFPRGVGFVEFLRHGNRSVVNECFNKWQKDYENKKRLTLKMQYPWMMDPCLPWEDEFGRKQYWQRMIRCPFCEWPLVERERPLAGCCCSFDELIEPIGHVTPSRFSSLHAREVHVHVRRGKVPKEYWIRVLRCPDCGVLCEQGAQSSRQCCRHYFHAMWGRPLRAVPGQGLRWH